MEARKKALKKMMAKRGKRISESGFGKRDDRESGSGVIEWLKEKLGRGGAADYMTDSIKARRKRK